jgi:hypothetical protein
VEDFNDLTDHQRQELSELTGASNERLEQAGAQGAEQAFGLGCALVGLPLALLILGLYLWGVFPLITAFIALVMGALVLLGVVTLLSFNAKSRAIGETYRKDVGPDIQAHLNRSQIQEERFNHYVSGSLPEDAPLRAFHSAPQLKRENPDQE